MELDITAFFHNAEPYNFSASAMELGSDAGKITWNNAMREAAETPLISAPEELDACRDFFRDFGAWSREEIDAWSPEQCNALLIQYISGDLRELEDLCMMDNGEIDWAEAERLASEGTIGGRIFRCDIPDHESHGRIFFMMD